MKQAHPVWDFDLRLQAGDFSLHAAFQAQARVVALFGPSGSGKSTLVEALAKVRQATGRAKLKNDASAQKLAALDSILHDDFRVGWVPQDAALFHHLTVRENIDYACKRPSVAARAVEVLGLSSLLSQMPATLSGGERQRVALARALASEPDLLLLDEPLSGVDLPRRASVFRFLLEARDAFETPMLYVSHDPAEVLAIADTVVLLDQGKVVATGEPSVLMQNATSLRLLDRLGFENVFRVDFPAVEPGHAAVVTTPAAVELVAPSPPQASGGGSGWLAVRAQDVLLARQEPQGLSARNILPGIVTATEETDSHVLIRINAGDEWVATLTRRALAELGIQQGAEVWVIAKTHSLHWLAE